MKKIIGIDFDGTCVTDLYPYVGDNIGAASVLRKLADRNLLILYTVRDGRYLQDAVDWFKYYAGEIWATSWEEAESFIKQRSSTEKVVGFIPSLEPVIEERPYMSIEFCKKEFFLLDEELESFKEFLNDPTRNIYHSIDGIKIVKSEDGKLCGVGRMPRHLRT